MKNAVIWITCRNAVKMTTENPVDHESVIPVPSTNAPLEGLSLSVQSIFMAFYVSIACTVGANLVAKSSRSLP